MCYLCRSKTTVLAGGRRRITDRLRFCARCEKIICDMEDKRLKATARLLEVMNTLRLALVGAGKGPGMYDVTSFIGKEETLRRIDNLLRNLKPGE